MQRANLRRTSAGAYLDVIKMSLYRVWVFLKSHKTPLRNKNVALINFAQIFFVNLSVIGEIDYEQYAILTSIKI